MCRLRGLSDKKTGYKVLAFKDDKFYSTFTLQEIKVGRVPLPPRYFHNMSEQWNQNGIGTSFKVRPFYEKNFSGKTSAFLHKIRADELKQSVKNALKYGYHDYKIVIVKITFSGDVYDGYYGARGAIIAGSQIESMEIVKK